MRRTGQWRRVLPDLESNLAEVATGLDWQLALSEPVQNTHKGERARYHPSEKYCLRLVHHGMRCAHPLVWLRLWGVASIQKQSVGCTEG